MKTTVYSILAILIFTCNLKAQNGLENHPDYAGVHTAISDYVEGLYEVDSNKIVRSVHPDLRKRGYWFNASESTWNDDLEMSYQQLKNLAASWNKAGNRANEHSPKVIEIYEINDRTAVGKLTAEWGIDFFQLAKYENNWMIVNVLWQSLPAPSSITEQRINSLFDSLGINPVTLSFHPSRHEMLLSTQYDREDQSQYLLIVSGLLDQIEIDTLNVARPNRSTFSTDGEYIIYNTRDPLTNDQLTVKRKYDGPDRIGSPLLLTQVFAADNMYYYMMDETEDLYYYTYVRNPRSDGGLLYSAFENGKYQKPQMIFPDRPNAVAYSPYLLDDRTMLFAQHGIQDNSTDGVYFSIKNEAGWTAPVRIEEIPFSNVIVPFYQGRVAFLKGKDERIKLYQKNYLKRLVNEILQN